jgi:ribosomal protein S7
MDEITINIRALGKGERDKIEAIIYKSLKLIPDKTNEEAVMILRNFDD